MSSGVFDRSEGASEIASGVQPGRDGAGLDDIVLSPDGRTATFVFGLRRRAVPLPEGKPGQDGRAGADSAVPGPQTWQTPPVPWASGTVYTATAPASTVTYQGSTQVCAISHTSGGTFDAAKFVMLAQRGIDGTGTLNGPVSSADGTLPLFDGTTGALLKDSRTRLSDLCSTVDAFFLAGF
ncbi:hypothetical protein [uncultured Methylobacterium sp.]|uniref:hypothetical protein n=1 Tax=uncultured Methylobacterium sp. TaxID=157278 RepID=UPI0035CC735D